MKLLLLRHGESIGNTKAGYISGRSDPAGLTDKGRSQIARTAWELRDLKINQIIASPVARVQETAQIIAGNLSLQIKTQEWLTELHHGMFEGYYWWEVIHKIPSTWRENREDFNATYPGGGESMKLLVERVWKGLQETAQSLDRSSTTVLVSHQAVIGAIRYCLIHGNPSQITTKKKEDAFLQFMHNSLLPNGGFVVADVAQNFALNSIKEFSSFDPIKEDKENLIFYLKGHFNNEHVIVKPLQSASTNSVYKIHNKKIHVLKVLDENNNDSAKRQAQIYTYLEGKNIPVPHVELLDTSNVFYKSPVMIQDYVEGEEQRVCHKEHKQKMPVLFKEVYKVMEQIHQIPIEEVKDFWYPQTEKQFLQWKPFMLFNCNYTLHHLPSFSLSEKEKQLFTKRMDILKEYIEKEKFTLAPIHGDLATGNIINSHKGSDCKLERIIDFEWARIGDPLWDYAYYWGWLERLEDGTATEWKEIVTGNMSQNQKDILNLYRLLFHAWTVRDMQEYTKSDIRKRRGKESLKILKRNLH